MGFKEDKRRILDALRSGRIGHERRSYNEEKNLLASGELAKEEVADWVETVRGPQAEASVHHFDPEQRLWILRPVVAGRRWYLKLYLVEETVMFLSCHHAEGEVR